MAEQRIKSDGVVVAIKGESSTKIAEPAIQLDTSDSSVGSPTLETESDSSPVLNTLYQAVETGSIWHLLLFSLPLRYLLFGVTKLN